MSRYTYEIDERWFDFVNFYKDDTFIGSISIYSTDIPLVIDIFRDSKIAVLNLKHRDSDIRKICRLRLKYKIEPKKVQIDFS